VNFKARITAQDNDGFLYANGTWHDFTIEVTNTGTEDCLGATFQLGFEDGLDTDAPTEKQLWRTIEPGVTKTVSLKLKCDAIEEEYAYKKITITVTDEISKKEWQDSVSVKFYKVRTYFYLTTEFGAAPVHGVVINPYDNKAARFKQAGGGISYVELPWSSQGYLVVFSGATAQTEAVYALGANKLPPYTAAEFNAFMDLGRYEKNDTEQTAAAITEDSMMAYLHKNDIDYYHFQVSEPESEPKFEDESVLVPSDLSLDESLAWIHENAVNGDVRVITLHGDEIIGPKTLSYGGKKVRITLRGDTAERTVSLSSNGRLFTVDSGVTLVLGNNVTLRGRSDNTASLVKVNSGGALVMNAGSKISGNTASSSYYSYGGGVYVSGTFTMSGGEISGNTANGGGGVSVNADGVFTMSGGEISGNTADYGGGVSVNAIMIMTDEESYLIIFGTFTKQSGGIIYGSDAGSALKNTAKNDYYGHAVYVTSAIKKRNTTAGVGVTLDRTKEGAAGGWE
jgi:hypothetical protein